ncbi:hypothetical protein FB45DRAFT_935441, partial [Roridomyces roridus]
MNGTNDGDGTEGWLRTHAGDMWAVSVPRHYLFPPPSESMATTEADPPLTLFARAFWGTWPLRIERYILSAVARAGFIFDLRKGGADIDLEGERRFVEKAKILGGGFIVEEHDAMTSAPTSKGLLHGPLIASWWLRPSSSDNVRVSLMGGYHSFAVEEPSPDTETVCLLFTSHLILSPPADKKLPPSTESMSTAALADTGIFNLRQRIVMHFHILYSRILLDLAVRSLEREAGTRGDL